MLIGRILFEDRICNVVYDKSEKRVFEIFSEISEVLRNTSEKIDISSKGIKIDEIKILIVPGRCFDQESISNIKKDAKKELGEEVTINIEIVEEIPREKSGKIKPIVSKLKMD